MPPQNQNPPLPPTLPPSSNSGGLLKTPGQGSKRWLLIFGALFAIIGGIIIWRSFATEPQPFKQLDFSSDPQWTGVNNRPNGVPCATIGPYKFGYSATNKVNGSGPVGEIGGPVADYGQYVAYYAKKLSTPKTLNDKLYASGSLILPSPDNGSSVLFGWFNSDSTDWRTNNFLGLRITNGYSNDAGNTAAYVDFASKRTLANGLVLKISDDNTGILITGHKATWTLTYDPSVGSNGTVTLKMETSTGTYQNTFEMRTGARQDGATFDHFGIYNSQRGGQAPTLDSSGHFDQGSTHTKIIYFDDLTLNTGPSGANQTFDFASDPGWEGKNNNPSAPLQDCWVHNREDFGYSAGTNYAGGGSGEIGGLVWNGVGARQSYYADSTAPLNLAHDTLYATGRIVVNHDHPDTDIPYVGWFNHSTSQWGNVATRSLDEQNFVGARLGGSSAGGHNFLPSFFNNAKVGSVSQDLSSIEPKTIARQFWICYVPNADSSGNGRVTTGLFGGGLPETTAKINVSPAQKTAATTFDSFGFITPNIGGAGFVQLFMDDLRYTTAPGDSGPADRCGTTPPPPPPPSGDKTPPTVSVTTPTNDSYGRNAVDVSANATDNVGVTSVQFKLDDKVVGSDSSAPYSLNLDTTKYASGNHNLQALASDAAKNTSAPAAVNLIIDNQAPSLSLYSPRYGAHISGSRVQVLTHSGDNLGISRAYFELDTKVIISDRVAPYRLLHWDSRTASNGWHVIRAKAYDHAGNLVWARSIRVYIRN